MVKSIPNALVLSDATMTSGFTLTSLASNVQSMSHGMYIASWTGTPTGTFSLEGSIDYDPARGTGEWAVLPITGSGNPAGSAANTYVQLTNIGCTWVRLKYTGSSGTGALTVRFSAKAG